MKEAETDLIIPIRADWKSAVVMRGETTASCPTDHIFVSPGFLQLNGGSEANRELRSCTKSAVRVQYASNLNRATSSFTDGPNPDGTGGFTL
jgi:hypothetical protein